jgi:hypothetical protein
MVKRYKRKPVTPRNRTVPPVQTEAFLAHRFAPAPDVPQEVRLAKKAICVNLPEEQDAIVRAMPDKTVWLRAAISAALADSPKSDFSLERLEKGINQFLMTIPPKRRLEAAKTCKKLLEYLQASCL